MQIRQEQMDTFSQAELTKFEARIADFLYSEFPDAPEVPREQLIPAIHEQVTKARSYGLETERQIANYVTTAWLLGQQFDTEFPAAQEMLKSSEYMPDDKSEWMAQWTEEMFAALEGDKNVLG
ncbi:hypothetical protein [Candidatus Marithrix sp. Canyon 246]|uniref:hypothetical protein n=1 Tax=Candidatus Marithrix sp. Canyon 246 TaxID=1827136 RepID=UPI000849FC85|nr:hypothetical protein [Candidatus Marithrix sp. Canyon 246]